MTDLLPYGLIAVLYLGMGAFIYAVFVCGFRRERK
jgi:F0F1-type ATP synthase assembly protein I